MLEFLLAPPLDLELHHESYESLRRTLVTERAPNSKVFLEKIDTGSVAAGAW